MLETACYELAIVAREEVPRLQDRLLADLREPTTRLSPRRLRFSPRVVKRASSSFRRKLPEHEGFTLKKQSFAHLTFRL